MSRIDTIILSSTLAPDLLAVGFGARVLSDHLPYWATFRLPFRPSNPHLEIEPVYGSP